jgi:GNAT superfamily N-acetyltransferase
MSDPVSVRPAAADDADAIARVQVETWRAAYRGTVPDAFLAAIDHAERTERWRQGFVERPERRRAWVAEAGGEVVGFVAFGPSRDDEASAGVGELYAIYVLAAVWRRGIGTVLHDVCMSELRRAGFSEATLWALDANPSARAFYVARGWQPDGTTVPHDFAGTELPLVRYRRAL